MEEVLPDKLRHTYTFIKAFMYGMFVSLDINTDVVTVLTTLMGIDTLVGVIKAVVLKKKVSFNIFFWGLMTKLTILIIPMVIALVAKGVGFNFKWLVDIVMDILVLSEGFSILSNIVSIREKREVKNKDVVSDLLNSIRKGMLRIIEKLTKTIEEAGDEEEPNNDVQS